MKFLLAQILNNEIASAEKFKTRKEAEQSFVAICRESGMKIDQSDIDKGFAHSDDGCDTIFSIQIVEL